MGYLAAAALSRVGRRGGCRLQGKIPRSSRLTAVQNPALAQRGPLWVLQQSSARRHEGNTRVGWAVLHSHTAEALQEGPESPPAAQAWSSHWRVVKHWKRLLKEVVEPPSSEGFMKQLDMALSALVKLAQWWSVKGQTRWSWTSFPT